MNDMQIVLHNKQLVGHFKNGVIELYSPLEITKMSPNFPRTDDAGSLAYKLHEAYMRHASHFGYELWPVFERNSRHGSFLVEISRDILNKIVV